MPALLAQLAMCRVETVRQLSLASPINLKKKHEVFRIQMRLTEYVITFGWSY